MGEGLAERVGMGLRRARIERGLTLRAMSARSGGIFKPSHWSARKDDDGTQHACCRECIKKAAEKSGKTDLVLPI